MATKPPLKGTIDGFEVDVVKSAEHTLAAEITDHPVEKGADTSDHIRLKATVLAMEVIVSNTPIGPIASRRGDVDGNGGLANAPSIDFLAWLEAIRTRREPIPVFTGTKSYEDMGLESFVHVEDATIGDALRVKCSFKQMQLVTNERTTVLVATPRAAKKVNLGTKPSPTVPDVPPKPAAAARDQSILHGLLF